MNLNCVWNVKVSDRLCGCCTIKGFCDQRIRPVRSAAESGARYIGIVKEVTGVDPLVMTRKSEAVWARNIVAYQMSLDGFIQEEIGKVIEKNRATVVNCIQNMKAALKCPNQYPKEVDAWNKFRERLSLEKI